MSSNQPTHKECVNFTWQYGGYCTLKNKNVNPNAPACPQFQPKQLAVTATSSSNSIDLFHLALGICFIAAGSLIIGHFILKWF